MSIGILIFFLLFCSVTIDAIPIQSKKRLGAFGESYHTRPSQKDAIAMEIVTVVTQTSKQHPKLGRKWQMDMKYMPMICYAEAFEIKIPDFSNGNRGSVYFLSLNPQAR
jgi:hypothetical protein